MKSCQFRTPQIAFKCPSQTCPEGANRASAREGAKGRVESGLLSRHARLRRRAFRCMICLFHACQRLAQPAAAHRALLLPCFLPSVRQRPSVPRSQQSERERERKEAHMWVGRRRESDLLRKDDESISLSIEVQRNGERDFPCLHVGENASEPRYCTCCTFIVFAGIG